jgi:hypothetical protein
MRSLASLGLFVCAVLTPAPVFASGQYVCCHINKQGDRVVNYGRAASKYKGDICADLAREAQAKACDRKSEVRYSFDLTKKPKPGEDEPDKHGLSFNCYGEKCAIGLLVDRGSKINVSPTGKAQCQLQSFPAPKNRPNVTAYTMHVVLPVGAGPDGAGNGCVVDIAGRLVRFYK